MPRWWLVELEEETPEMRSVGRSIFVAIERSASGPNAYGPANPFLRSAYP
jgi:hypothetical protein